MSSSRTAALGRRRRTAGATLRTLLYQRTMISAVPRPLPVHTPFSATSSRSRVRIAWASSLENSGGVGVLPARTSPWIRESSSMTPVSISIARVSARSSTATGSLVPIALKMG